MRILVFGASITQGFWDPEGGWVNRLRKHYDELELQNFGRDKYPTVFNLGISGDTTKDLLKRFDAEAQARIWPGQKLIIILSIGTNNAIAKNGKLSYSPEEYRSDLEALLRKARDYADEIMMVSSPCCDESLTNPVSWNQDISYSNDALANVNEQMRRLCKDESIPYVDIYGKFREAMDNGQDLFQDGLHPNARGHKLILEAVRPVLGELAGLQSRR